MPLGAPASQLEEALDAGESGTNFLEGALTGLYQTALASSEDTGSYEADLIGSIVLKKRGAGIFGDTDFVFWAFSVNNIGSLQSTGQMRDQAGLAALYGRPTKYQKALGYDEQYGLEAYYRFGISGLFRILPSVQRHSVSGYKKFRVENLSLTGRSPYTKANLAGTGH